MSQDELYFSSQTLLLKISAITGWTIPLSEMMDILIDQFQKTLCEKYQFTNIEEFEYAFRSRGLEIKDWGKSLNLGLIDEVMMPYLESRKEISRFEESNLTKMQIEEKKELTADEWDEWINDAKNYPFEILPTAIYDFLEKQGSLILSKKEKHGMMDKAIAYASSRLEGKEFIEFMQMKSKGIFSGHYLATLITLSKRFAISSFFENQKCAI